MTLRTYKKSSSFKVATLFAILIAVAVSSLIISTYIYSSELFDKQPSNIFIMLSVVSILALLFIAVAGYLISVFVVTRINRITSTANEIIATGDLSKRLDVDSRWDDLSFLAGVLNEMLDKIETLMNGVQHITDTVAHDLRTPLARLRNNLERISLQATNHQQKTDEEILPLIREVDGLIKTFNSLLSLSSLESGRQSLAFELFDLEKVLIDAIDFYQPLAEEKELIFIVDTQPLQFLGDRDLLFQVIANLLDNAIKFTPPYGKVEIKVHTNKDYNLITIADNGPGIPVASTEKVFERFYREQDQLHQAGSGLGLSLVQVVLEMHHARISLEDNNPGLKVSLRLNKPKI
jgi:signal transduction histidine kinase